MPLRSLLRDVWSKLIGSLLGLVYLLWSRTWRIKLIVDAEITDPFGSTAHQKFVYSHWHGDELAVIGLASFKNFAALASFSKDGAIMAAALRTLGFRVSRGSSSKGGARGLVALIRLAKQGCIASLAVDGPRGPRHQPKAGILVLARALNAQIVPVWVNCGHAYHFRRSWNKAYLPWPFSRITYHLGAPLDPGKGTDEEILRALRCRMLPGIPDPA